MKPVPWKNILTWREGITTNIALSILPGKLATIHAFTKEELIAFDFYPGASIELHGSFSMPLNKADEIIQFFLQSIEKAKNNSSPEEEETLKTEYST